MCALFGWITATEIWMSYTTVVLRGLQSHNHSRYKPCKWVNQAKESHILLYKAASQRLQEMKVSWASYFHPFFRAYLHTHTVPPEWQRLLLHLPRFYQPRLHCEKKWGRASLNFSAVCLHVAPFRDPPAPAQLQDLDEEIFLHHQCLFR